MNIFTFHDLKEEIEELSRKSYRIFDRFAPIIHDDNLEANITVITAIKGQLKDIENKLAELEERCRLGFYFGLKIHLGLHVNNSQRLGYKWAKDIKFPEKKMVDYYKILNEKGYILGKTKNVQIASGYYGLYKPIIKEKPLKLLEDLADNSLTPENAEAHGYDWIQDTIYDREAPIEAMEDLIHLAKDKGYKIGKPAGDEKYFCGVYAPISKKKVNSEKREKSLELKQFLQEVLDHAGCGKIHNIQTHQGYWFVRTNRGEFVVNESADESKVRQKYPTIESIKFPDYKGELTVKEIHKKDQYYSIYQVK